MEEPVELSRPQALRRACIVIAALASIWAYAVAITGGFVLDAGVVRFSSRSPRAPLLLTILAVVGAWTLDRKAGWQRRSAADLKWLTAPVVGALPQGIRRHATARAFAGVVAALTVIAGIFCSAHVAAGADSYGYVSQARLFVTGQLKVAQPLLDDMPADIPREALAPLGYRLSPDKRALVPTYSPGLPMVMAVFERVGGPRAVYLVMPLLAGLAIWMTYALGRLLIGDLGGSLAALFFATSPAFLVQLLYPPMSDIVAAAWWTTAIVTLWRPGRVAAFATGAATAAAILTRPNLVPLAAVLGVVFLSGLSRRDGRSLAVQRLLLFTMPAAAACVVVAWLNAYWYGSPTASGYGNIEDGGLFRWEYFWPNLTNYAAWAFQSQGVLSLLGLVGLPALWQYARARGAQAIFTAAICFAATVYACYAFYLPLDTWWTLRFLFPAFPVFFILIVAGGLAVIDRLPDGWRSTGVAAFVVAMTIHTTAFGRTQGVFTPWGELRYETAGRYINDHTPPRAAFFTMLHSGSVRHYSGRLTIRYDWIEPDRFEALVTHLHQRGYATFLLIDDAEEDQFRRRFAGSRVLDALGSPQVRFPSVGLYPLTNTAAR
jgi:hypothetical protein